MPEPSAPKAALPPTAALARRVSGSPLLVLLDVDGTLAPIAPTPDEAVVPTRTRHTLEALAALPDVHLVAVTGRAARDAHRMLGTSQAWVIGNHGMERLQPQGTLEVNPRVAPYEPAIVKAAEWLTRLTGRTRGMIVENKRLTLSVHYRLADHTEVPHVERDVREAAREFGLRVTAGKEVFELRPPVDIDKGTAVLDLARELGVSEAPDSGSSVLYAGDDRTDEDAFRLLRAWRPDSVTIHVGNAIVNGAPTEAEFLLRDTERMRELLDWLLLVRAGDGAPGALAAPSPTPQSPESQP